MKLILGKKIGMTQLWKEEEVVPVTKVQAGPCVVTQVKNEENDGYRSVQVGFATKKKKNINKPQAMHLNKLKQMHNGLKDNFRYLREFRFDNRVDKKEEKDPELEVGNVITADTFSTGDKVDVTGRSKGRGFQGVVRRYNFGGSIKTHGTKHEERRPGSAGAMGAGRIFKGKKMPGQMGARTVTTKNLEIIEVDIENNMVYIKGSIAGSPNDLLLIQGEGELSKKTPEEVPSILEEGGQEAQETPVKEQEQGEGQEQAEEASEGTQEQGEEQETSQEEEQKEDTGKNEEDQENKEETTEEENSNS